MSHLVESIAYASKTPWHGAGVPVEEGAGPRAFARAAKLDWQVEKVPLHYIHDGADREIDRYALIRSTDGQFLDTVKSKHWKPVQNHEAFAFFEHIARAGDMTMDVAGSLANGRRVFALARLGSTFHLARARDDVTATYLLFTNPHLYGQSVDVRITPIRVVCSNMLTLALGRKDAECRLSFTHRRAFDAAAAAERLIDLASSALDAYRQKADFLASREYSQDALDDYFEQIFGAPATARILPDDSPPKPRRNVLLAREVVETQPGHSFAPGTWWNAFNAVTYLTDHKLGRNPDSRLHSAWYGRGQARKTRALDLAVAYAKAA